MGIWKILSFKSSPISQRYLEPSHPLYWEACIYDAGLVSIPRATKPLPDVHGVPVNQSASHNLQEHGSHLPLLQIMRLKLGRSFIRLKHSSRVTELALKTGPSNSGALIQRPHPHGMQIRWKWLHLTQDQGKEERFLSQVFKGESGPKG